MMLVIPDGAPVQIVVGNGALLAPAYGVPGVRPRRRRLLLTGMAVAALAVGSYQYGLHSAAPSLQQTALAGPPSQTGPASITPPVLPPGPAFDATGRPQPTATVTPPPGQVPPEFAQLLRQPPTVVPPPGQPAPGGPNAFGLHP